MKILYVIDSLSTGGAEKLVVDVIPRLVAKGNIVDVVLLNKEKTHLYNQLSSMGCCNIYGFGFSYYNPLYIFRLIPYMYKYKIIHVHLFPAQYFVAIARLFCFRKVTLIFTEHNTSNTRLENSKYKWLEKLIYQCYNKILCITNEVSSVLQTKLKIKASKLVVIENGVDINVISKCDKSLRSNFLLADTDKLLIMVAGFRLQKDQDTVIKTLKKLPNNYKLLLVGDGERRKKLENLVSSLELNQRVFFLGIQSNVHSIVKMCDIAILSSHWEGFGLVAVEAMASGIPLIASNVNGLAQVVEGGGLLFNASDTNDLYKVIMSLDDVNIYNDVSQKGLMKSKKYDINDMVDSLLSVYEQK